MADSGGGWSNNDDENHIYGAITIYSILHILIETVELSSETGAKVVDVFRMSELGHIQIK